MNSIKEIIQNRLTEKHITAKKLCEEIGITEQSLYAIYRNNSASKRTLNKINEFLDLDLSKSFSVTTEENQESIIIEYLRKENEFLKSFIREKLAINFKQGVLLPTCDHFFLHK